MTYSEAMQRCLSLGDSLASKKQLSSTSTPIPDGIPAWSKDKDMVQFSSGKLTVTPCVNKPSQLASAYCFNPNITDFIPVIKDDKLWLKIAIVCIISSIFIILLMAVTFMKGNKCICCVKRKKPAEDSTLERGQGFDTVRGLHRDRIPSYQISGARTKPPVLSKALNTGYSSHYSNHGFESTPEASKQNFAKTYVDHDRYEYSNAAFDNTY
ncbi:uncharacterized protein LOC131696783 [Acipenser ruthenus]|uniref:uncharacterized protein LOC131696783 n=1 Tax=Acipenser ruthenus TaxID=7906 RepID=UPI002741E714|nr:uncharacterized protein LOC131696783 [Acipenser ruthenus]